MRLSWFSGSRFLGRPAQRRRRKTTTLRVRQLERRRVLDGAVTALVVSAVTTGDSSSTNTSSTSTTTSSTDTTQQQPLSFNWTPPPGANQPASESADLAQGTSVGNTPPVLVVPLDQNVNEGQPLDLSGQNGAPPIGFFIDPDFGDTHTATVDWGDGNPVENTTIIQGIGSGALGSTHTYADQGTYTVTINVTDSAGGSDFDTFQVIVAPVAPTATLANNGPVVEGSDATVAFSNQFDPSSADTAAGFRYAYDLNNDGTFDVGDGTYAGSVTDTSQNISAALLGDGPSDHTVAARIIDKDGQFTDYQTTIHVNNAAPTLTNITGDTIDENETATISATIVDPSATDTFEVDVDWLDGSTATITGLGASDASGTVGGTTYEWTAATRQLELSHKYLDDGLTTDPSDTYNVSLVVRDNNMDASGPYIAPVLVNDLPPVLVVASPQNVFEGDLLDLSGMSGAPPIGLFIDNGTLDTHTATVNWGDGSATQNATIIQGMGAGALGASHVYADDGAYTVTVTVTDKDGKSDSDTFTVTVGNRAPVVQVPHGNQSITEGDTVTFSDLATFTDPGFDNPLNPNPADPPSITDPLSESFTYDINWGDGRDAITGASIADLNGGPGTPSSGTVAGSHTYADDGVYTVTITVHDDNGGSNSASFTVTVNNANPVVTTPHGDQTITEGGTVSFPDLATFTDPGFDNPANPNLAVPPNITDPLHESFTYDINWGDGRDAITGASVADLNGSSGTPSSGTIAGSHTYADDGVYTVTVTVHDDNGGSNSASFTVTVNNANPVVNVPHGNQTITEGGTVSFPDLATFTDPGFDNPANPNAAVPPNISDPLHESFTYDINWGDGTGAVNDVSIADINGNSGTPSSGTIAGSHTYADDGVYTVTVTVHDDNGGIGTTSFTVTVNNANPIVTTPHGNQTITEGSTVSFADLATFTDPGFDNPSNPNAAVPPNITDPLHESFTYDINWGDGRDAITGASIADLNGSPGVPSSGSINASHTYADDGVYTVTVTVHDDNGGVSSASFTVTVANANPVVNVPHGDQTITEGGTVAFPDLATFTDPGFDNPLNPSPANPPSITDPLHESFTYDINWGDGRDAITGASVADLNGSPGVPSTGSINASHTYADDGVYTVTVTVHDDNGGVSSASFTVTVNNANPVVTTPHGNQNISEGDTLSFSDLANFTDAGFDNPLNPNTANPPSITDPLHESFTYDIDWGDGRDAITGASIADLNGSPGTPSTGTIAASHTYADDGAYQVTVTVHDDNGGVGTSTFLVTVANLNPVVTTPNGNQSISEGQTVSFTNLATFTDAGFDNPNNNTPFTPPAIGDPKAETFTYDIDWGDGRDAITGASIADLNGSPGVPSSGTIAGSHTYADDGAYTVTVTVHDDNGGLGVATFKVLVTNVEPTLTGTTGLAVDEGQTFTLNGLGVGVTDPGFDNPLNTLDPSNGGETEETLSAMSINWGDGTATQALSLAEFQAVPFAGPTTATFPGASHTFADNGTYTVTVTIKDDDMASFVERTFTIEVRNVVPTLSGFTSSPTTINEAGSVNFNVNYSDPGFDNPLNTLDPANGGEVAESFTYDINWGDGRQEVASAATPDINGSPGVASTGNFGGTHIYADDGTYTVTFTIHDDDGGSSTQTFQIIVNNVAPTITSPLAGVDVTNAGTTHIQLSYSDPGFDNTHNPNPLELPNVTDRLHESFTHVITWGDGSVDAVHTYAVPGTYEALVTLPGSMTPIPVTITVTDVDKPPVLTLVDQQASLNVPGTEQLYTFTVNWGDDPAGNNDTIQTITVSLRDPVLAGFTPFVTDRTVVLASARNVGTEGVPTTGNFDIQHQYLGPPDPLHPTQDIPITVSVVDDNMGAAAQQQIMISNPGIQEINVAIDTTPDVPRLVYVPPVANLVFIDRQATAPQNVQNLNTRVAIGEVAATSDRYLELVVISPEGKELQRYRLRDEAITDLRGLIATLPDNHYKIYLVRTDNNSRRLVIDVYVRRGRVVDPSDSSEGTRDRPPEGAQQLQAQPNEGQPIQAQPLDNNPKLDRVPDENPGAQTAPTTPGASSVSDNRQMFDEAVPPSDALQPAPSANVPSAARFRWGASLAAVGIAAARGSWSRDVEAAFEQADEQSWQRLRRAARTRRPR